MLLVYMTIAPPEEQWNNGREGQRKSTMSLKKRVQLKEPLGRVREGSQAEPERCRGVVVPAGRSNIRVGSAYTAEADQLSP